MREWRERRSPILRQSGSGPLSLRLPPPCWRCNFLSSPYPGLQADEVVFVTPFYSWKHTAICVAFWIASQIPVMSVDYLGTLKSLLYWPVFKIWAPNDWSIRVPVCMVSVGTLLIFGSLVRRAAGPGIAILACLLLASDCSFIFVNVFDWGPVSLLLFAIVARTRFDLPVPCTLA